LTVGLAVLAFVSGTAHADNPVVPRPDLSRAAQLVEGVIVGTHAYQIRLARVAGKGSDECWAAPEVTDEALEALVAHQAGLFASNRLAVKDWMAGRDHMRFDPARDLYPLLSAAVPLDRRLPVNVFTERAVAASHKPLVDVRSVAILYQLILEVERDGDELQDAFAFLTGLGLPVYAGQLGMPGDDASLAAFGATLAPLTCAAPFATDADAWRDAGRKVWNWGEKHLGVRDASVVARELSATPGVRAVVNRLRTVAPTRVAIIGHSFTMGNHWASPGSFTTIAAGILTGAHVPIETRHYSAGGLTATRAVRTFEKEVVEWQPKVTLLVVAVRNDEDLAALGSLIASLRTAGSSVLMFDSVNDTAERDDAMRTRRNDAARVAGARIVPVADRLAASPDRATFLSLDGIHMTEPYHRVMALAWLEALDQSLH
jgi:hypothetical protein